MTEKQKQIPFGNDNRNKGDVAAAARMPFAVYWLQAFP